MTKQESRSLQDEERRRGLPLSKKLLICLLCVLVCGAVTYLVCEHAVEPTYSDSTASITVQMHANYLNIKPDLKKEDGTADILTYFQYSLNSSDIYQKIASAAGVTVAADTLRANTTWEVEESDASGRTIRITVACGDDATAPTVALAAADQLNALYRGLGPSFPSVISEPELLSSGERIAPNTWKAVLIACLVCAAVCLIVCLSEAEVGKLHRVYKEDDPLPFLKLTRGEKRFYRFLSIFFAIPGALRRIGQGIWGGVKALFGDGRSEEEVNDSDN